MGAAALLPFIKSGKVRCIATGSTQRLPQLPDVPTMAEVGHPELNLTSWTGLAAPAGTPEAVVQTLYKAVRQVATSPAMVTNLKERGVIVPEEMPPAAFDTNRTLAPSACTTRTGNAACSRTY